MAVKQSLVRLRCRDLLSGREPRGDRILSCRWTVEGSIRGALFRRIKDPTEYAILHLSPKRPGWWQLSKFDAQGAWGDVVRETPDKALADGLDYARWWRLEQVVGAGGVELLQPRGRRGRYV